MAPIPSSSAPPRQPGNDDAANMLLTFAPDGGLHLDGDPVSEGEFIDRASRASELFVMGMAGTLRAQAATVMDLLRRSGLNGRFVVSGSGD